MGLVWGRGMSLELLRGERIFGGFVGTGCRVMDGATLRDDVRPRGDVLLGGRVGGCLALPWRGAGEGVRTGYGGRIGRDGFSE